MTYEQKYGRPPDGLIDLETPPEEWQLENPIATGKITGYKRREVPKLNLEAILPQNKEVDIVDFKKLSMDKQLKMVAKEYNKGTSNKAMCEKFGVGIGTLYSRINAAHKAGLIPEMRLKGKATPELQVEVVPVEEGHVEVAPAEEKPVETPEKVQASPLLAPAICPEFFREQAEYKRQRAASLAEGAERLEQAGMIATALADLLGDDASDLINGLYVRVS